MHANEQPSLSPTVALATCAEYPDGTEDDARFLTPALDRAGISWRWATWNDPAVEWAAFDACCVRSTWDYFLEPDGFAAWVDRTAAQTRLFNPARVLHWNADKRYLADLAAAHLDVVPTIYVPHGESIPLAATAAQHGWRDGLVIKPAVSAGAWELVRLDAAQAHHAGGQAALDRLTTMGTVLVQPYLAAVETGGELSVHVIDGVTTHAVRKVPATDDFRTQPEFGSAVRRVDPEPQEARLVADTLRALESILDSPDLLYARVDLLGGMLGEVEVIEPALYLEHAPEAADSYAAAVASRLGADGAGRGLTPNPGRR